MTACPECSSANIESLLTMRDDRLDDRALTITKYLCKNCGCRFELREHWAVEVIEHGKELQV
jgi:transcription elongation factor Elf1